MYKLDLHTHSSASPDGGVTEKEYEKIIAKKVVDVVAITDHNRIDFAKHLQKKLGEKIIVGEEISTQEGDVIGLFLDVEVDPHQSVARTIQSIHKQGGLVYIPHPFDSFRKGIGEKVLIENLSQVDILESFNGRMILPWQNSRAATFARQHRLLMATSSDAHTAIGIGNAYTMLGKKPTISSIKELLKTATFHMQYQPLKGYIQPFLNRLKKSI